MEIAIAALPQKPYKGKADPLVTTLSTNEGSARYSGTDPAVKARKTFLLPTESEIVAQPSLPPVKHEMLRSHQDKLRTSQY